MSAPDCLVVIPTYNEIDNLAGVVERLRASVPDAHVLIVDDNSPDGTGDLADRLAADDDAVHVLHRPGKSGLGSAYRAGLGWGLERGYAALVEMDADGSHLPEQLPRLLAALPDADLVLGARWIPGGRAVNWPWRREWLSRGANTFARLALGLSVHDATGGFRVYRPEVLKGVDVAAVTSQGYCFQIEMVRLALLGGFRVVEVPITFVERVAGYSKMSGAIVREALVNVTKWGIAHRLGQLGRGARGLVKRSDS